MIACSRRYPILLLLLLCVLSLDSLAPAQTMTIRLVNGKTGKPLAKKDVTVSFWRDDPSLRKGVAGVQVKGEEWVNISLDKHGIGLIDLPPLATKVQVVAGFREGRVDNIRIRYRLDRHSIHVEVGEPSICVAGRNYDTRFHSGNRLYAKAPGACRTWRICRHGGAVYLLAHVRL